MSNRNKFFIITLLIIIAGSVVFFLFNSSRNRLSNNINKDIIQVDEEETIEKDLITDVFLEENDNILKCLTEECFEEAFSKCQPAEFQIEDKDFLMTTSYEIKKLTENGCQIRMEYLKHLNSDWENLEMYCLMNNKVSFKLAKLELFIKENLNCEGPLYNSIKEFTKD